MEALSGIFDTKHRMVSALGATRTPEAVLVDAEGKILYRGRINNRYPELGKARRVITEHDLRAALSEATSGKPVTVSRTTAIGCYIPTLPEPTTPR